MEEAARLRLERLKGLAPGGAAQHAAPEAEFVTAETVAQRLVAESTFVPDQQGALPEARRVSADLRREYERRLARLDEQTSEMIDSLISKRIDEDLAGPAAQVDPEAKY